MPCFIFSQDEYEDKNNDMEIKKVESVPAKNDSIDVSEKTSKKKRKKRSSDASKAYKGMSDFKRNIRIGGAFNIGSYFDAGLNSQLFYFQLSPQMTYVMSEYFEGGLSTSYSYTGSFDRINSHSISAGPILRAYPIPEIFLQVEGVGFYNTLNIDDRSFTDFNINAFIGGGVVSRFSPTSYLLTGIKVNLMKNQITNNQIIPTAFTSIHFGLW